jgi:6-phosphogluconolactonase (cycloisomerase 2 family)
VSAGGSISVYGGNVSGTVAEAPFATITGSATGLLGADGIAIDSTGKIYVSNDNSSVEVFPANPSGTLNEAPIATISGSNTGLSGNIEGIALDANGKIYVANTAGAAGTGAITVYPANPVGTLNEAPLATIGGTNTGLTTPFGLAVDSSGRIYAPGGDQFDNAGTVTVYAANPSGTLNESPLATIAGGNTGLDGPWDLAFDAGGKIYVANQYDSSITVYAANPSGTLNESPLATIAGNATGLDTPTGVAIDGNGKIYVVNNATVTIYAANPSGTLNEAPLATITGISGPYAIAVH